MYLLYTSFIAMMVAMILMAVSRLVPEEWQEDALMGAGTLALAVSCITFLAIGFIGKV